MTISAFCQFYQLTRRQVEYRVQQAMLLNGGRFELPGLGAFQAVRRGTGKTSPIDIEMWEAAAPGSASPQPDAAKNSPAPLPASIAPASPEPPPFDTSALPLHELTESELKRRLQAAKVEQIEQSTALSRARFRDEVVGYCASVFELILSSLRASIDDIHLTDAQADAFFSALDAAASDMDAVLPGLISGVPLDKLDLELCNRRAARARPLQPPNDLETQPESSADQPPAQPDCTPAVPSSSNWQVIRPAAPAAPHSQPAQPQNAAQP